MGNIFQNEYPYTDFHELNADWILNKINELATDWLNYKKSIDAKYDTLESAFKDLKEYVENYFANTDFNELVSNEIAKYVSDGTLASFVDGEINLVFALGLRAEEDINLNNKLNNYINMNRGSTFYMPAGIWTINTKVQFDRSDGTVLHSDNGCTYRTDGIDEMFVLSNWNSNVNQGMTFNGGVIDASNVKNCVIAVRWTFLLATVRNMIIKNIEDNCIGICVGTIQNYSTRQMASVTDPNMQSIFENLQIYGRHDRGRMEGSGIYLSGTDGYASNVGIVFCKHGFEELTGGNKLVNIHIATGQELYPEGLTPEELTEYYAIKSAGGIISNVQIDNYYVGFRIKSSYNSFDVTIKNYTYNVAERPDTTMDAYLNASDSLACAIYEFANKFTNNGGNRLNYDVRTIRNNGCINTHIVNYGSGNVLNYAYKIVQPVPKNSVVVTNTTAKFTPLVDEAYRVRTGDGFDLTTHYNYRRTTYALIGYVTHVGSNTNTYYTTFNLAFNGGSADVTIRLTNGIPSTVSVNNLLSMSPNIKVAVDKTPTRIVNGVSYFPIYLTFESSGPNITCTFSILAKGQYMPAGFYLTKNKSLYSAQGITDTYEVASLNDGIEVNLY